ncbi:MAG: hypothetical protein IH946_11145 [Bacteroidetes bacterium]|nr:hypothetical protein [Bacteroidota bacterium]
MKRLLIIILTLILAVPSNVNAQTYVSTSEIYVPTAELYVQTEELYVPTTKFHYPHQIGIGAGFTTGLGFSYRYWPGIFGIQINGLPAIGDNSFFLSVGATGLMKISRHHELVTGNFYLYFGNHLIAMDYNSGGLFHGFGTGFSFDHYHFSLNFMFGIAMYNRFYEVNSGPQAFPTLEVGLYYRIPTELYANQ